MCADVCMLVAAYLEVEVPEEVVALKRGEVGREALTIWRHAQPCPRILRQQPSYDRLRLICEPRR